MRAESTPPPALEQEEWRPAPGYERAYEVSSLGRVRRSVDAATGGHKAGRVLNPTPSKKGYLSLPLYDGGKSRRLYVHRLVCEAFFGPPPSPIHQAAHKNGIHGDNRAENLRWALPVENAADSVTNGAVAHGARNGQTRLDAEAVARIFRLRADGWSQGRIAAEFDITQGHVSEILAGKKRRRAMADRLPEAA